MIPRRSTNEPRGGEPSLRAQPRERRLLRASMLHTREREDRVEFRGAARGQITGEKRDDDPRKGFA